MSKNKIIIVGGSGSIGAALANELFKENYLIVCKNKTCSNKIKTIEELKSIIKNYAIE